MRIIAALALASVTWGMTCHAHRPTESDLQRADNTKVYVSQRPAVDLRKFHSEAVEQEIKRIKKLLKNPYLSWMFENCYPNTLDTTVLYGLEDGDDDTYVITGDINAMWLRDSSAQVYPYLSLARKDKKLQKMLRGVI